MVYIYFAKHILCKIPYTYPILYDCPRKLRSCQRLASPLPIGKHLVYGATGASPRKAPARHQISLLSSGLNA